MSKHMCRKLPGVPSEQFWTTALQQATHEFCWSRWKHGIQNFKLLHL